MSVYTLNHSELPVEIERLEWQHRNLLVPVMGNYLLPPDILAHLNSLESPESSEKASSNGVTDSESNDVTHANPKRRAPAVADIGTGTGVWLVDLATELPADARLDGFDYVTSKFRPVAARQPNVTLEYADALKPFAPELHGQYDVVHVRLLILGLKPSDWRPLTENVLALLRPGGWLVWEEIDLQHFTATPTTPSSPTAQVVDTMLRFSRALGQNMSYPIGLDKLFREVGFVDASQQVYKVSDHWDEPVLFKNTEFAFLTIVKSYLQGVVDAGGFEGVRTKEDVARLAEQTKKELDASKSKVDYWFWRTVGRKPSA